MLVLFLPCCYGFAGLGGAPNPVLCVHNGTEFASAQSAEIESVELTSPCARWVAGKEVYSLRKYTGPFGIRSRAKAPLETVWLMEFHKLPPEGPWLRTARSGFLQQVRLPGRLPTPCPRCCRLPRGLQVKTTPVWLHRLFLRIS